MIKICLLKNKLIPNENNAETRKSIHSALVLILEKNADLRADFKILLI